MFFRTARIYKSYSWFNITSFANKTQKFHYYTNISVKFFLRWVQEFRLNTMRMEFLSTSCGGTSSVMVRRSTFWYDSIQGNTKNSPAKIYHDKRWSLNYQCYKIKLIAVSTTILHIFSVVFVVKLFPDTYIISV